MGVSIRRGLSVVMVRFAPVRRVLLWVPPEAQEAQEAQAAQAAQAAPSRLQNRFLNQ
jgi:hypothetical protein